MLRSWIMGLVAAAVVLPQVTWADSAERMYVRRVEFSDITGWMSDNHVEAFGAFLKSCADFANTPDGTATGRDQFLAPAVVWKRLCRKAELLGKVNDETTTRRFFEQEFVPARLTSDAHEHAFLTGYYEPQLEGSHVKARPYVYPVYGLPVFPVSYTRAQIESLGYLNGKAPVIAYVDDPVKLFFLHVQGSGSIQIGCGETLHVGYAGNNKQPYVSIGKFMVQQGMLTQENVTMQSISQWLYAHPDQMWHVMWENPSFIFFHEMTGGPLGTERVPLTPERSLAVDNNYLPLGMPVFVTTAVPGKGDAPFTLWRKLMIAQDTGRAILGPMRGDIFFGSGFDAEQFAGRMKAAGDFTLLVPHELFDKMSKGQ